MRAFALACLLLPGCYLSHERAAELDCGDGVALENVAGATTIPIGDEALVGRFRMHNRGGVPEGIITAWVTFDGLFSFSEPVRVRVLLGTDAPEHLLFVGEVSGPGEVLPIMATPLPAAVASDEYLDLFVLVDSAGLMHGAQMEVLLTGVLYGDPLAPERTCGASIEGPTMTFVEACPIPGIGEFHFDPPDHGPGRGCLTTGMFPRRDFCPSLAPGDLLKSSLHSVYVIDRDGRKVVFPTEVELMSWFADLDTDGVPTAFRSGAHICSIVPELSDEAFGAITLASRVVTVRPGVHVLGFASVPGMFWLVSRGNSIRPVTEEVARAIYGPSFDRRIYVIDDVFFGNYHLGSEVRSPEEYDVSFESAALLLDELEVRRP